MDRLRSNFTFVNHGSQWNGKLGSQVPSRYDSGLGSLASLPSMSAEHVQPPRPTLVGGAAAIHEECESGVFSGGVFCGEDHEADGTAHNSQEPVHSELVVSEVPVPPSKELAAMSLSSISQPARGVEMLKTVRMEKAPTQKTKSSRPRVRRPHRNFSNATLGSNSGSNRSSTSSPPNSGGLQSLPSNHPADLGNNNSGVFTNSHMSLPQSWDTGYGSHPSSVSSIDNFSGNSAMNMPWPTIDIFELQQNVQYFLPNRDGDTGFHLSVIHSENDLLDKLLFIMSRDNRLRTVIDEQNNLYQTALHLATHMQQTEMIRKLLIAGASLNITDHKGNTPLHIAARFSSTKCLEEIIRYMSVQTILQVATIKNNQGLTCIHIAAKQGNMDILRKFKSLGVNMDMQDLNSGKTALHSVVEKGSLTDVQFMLETCRANINATTYTGCTPLHIASGRGDIALTAYLLSMGANPDLVTDEGDTALDLAGSDQVMTLLTKAAALRWLY